MADLRDTDNWASRGVVGVVLFVVAAMYVMPVRPADDSGQPLLLQTRLTIVPPAGAAREGATTAKAVIIEFTDFECPFCGRYAREIRPLVSTAFVESGVAEYRLINFPLPIHPMAVAAAQAAECAGAQGQYWRMHDLLFSNQQAWSRVEDPEAAFAKLAGSIGHGPAL